jgi:peroxiredoxin
MTGEQFARELIQVKPEVNIIICTGFSESFSQKNAEKMGILQKYFTLSEDIPHFQGLFTKKL